MIIQIGVCCWGILLFASQVCAQSPTPRSGNGFFGKWLVKNVFCSNCKDRKPAEIGTILEFTDTYIKNPLGENCIRDPGYSLLNEESGNRVVARYGKQWPRSVIRATLNQERVRYGFFTCGGINLMQVLFISERRGFYFFEGGVAFDLQRLEPGITSRVR